MKNSKQITDTVLQKRDEYYERARKKQRQIKKICSAFSAVVLAVVSLYLSQNASNLNNDLNNPNVDRINNISETDTTAISEKNTNTSIPETTRQNAVTSAKSKSTGYISKAKDSTEAVSTVKNSTIYVSVTENSTEYIPTVNNSTECVSTGKHSTECVSTKKSSTKNVTTAKTSTKYISSKNSTERVSENTQTEAIKTSTVESSEKTTDNYSTADHPTPTEVSSQPPTHEDSVFEPQWDELTIEQKFVEFSYNGYIFTSRVKKADPDAIETKINDFVFTCYNEENRYQANAALYKINNISENCAAAVRFQGYDDYYVYTNHDFIFSSLGELFECLDLENTLSFGDMYSNETSIVSDYNKELVMVFLKENGESQFISDYDNFSRQISFSINVELLGINNKSLMITDDGHIITNILEKQYTFYVGEEKIDQFIHDLELEKTEENTDIIITDDLIEE